MKNTMIPVVEEVDSAVVVVIVVKGVLLVDSGVVVVTIVPAVLVVDSSGVVLVAGPVVVSGVVLVPGTVVVSGVVLVAGTVVVTVGPGITFHNNINIWSAILKARPRYIQTAMFWL